MCQIRLGVKQTKESGIYESAGSFAENRSFPEKVNKMRENTMHLISNVKGKYTVKWLWFSFCLICFFNAGITFAGPITPNPFIIHPKENIITERYIKMFDRDIENTLKSFDPQTGLIKTAVPENGVAIDPAIEKLSLAEKKEIAEKPEYIWSYGQSRGTAQLASALAYAYSIKQSRYFQSSETLTIIKQIFRTFFEHQAESGEFVFSSINYSTVFGTHEMAWRLEPLICAYENIKSDLSESDKRSFRIMLNRAMEFLYTNENSSLSNRGVVWCGVMAMCYRFSGEEKYLQAANRTFQWVGRLFNADGEVREGPGPDLIYSTVSLQYLFLYRLMSGDTSLDPLLVKSLQWYTRLFTSSAVPLEGMTTRMWISNGKEVSDMLGALTFYADQDSSFGQIATRYLEALETLPAGFTISHSSAYFLRGAQYHPYVKELNDVPFHPYAKLYKSDHSLYYLYGANYQTAVTLRGRKPMKGLQTWSYKGQPPLIYPTRMSQSFARGIGFDSHLMDAPWDVSPSAYRTSKIEDGLNVLVNATGSLRTAYVFANDLTVVIYHSNESSFTTEWVSYASIAAEFDHIAGQQIFFKNSDATIIFSRAAPAIIQDKDIVTYRFKSNENSSWFAFAGPESGAQVTPIDQELFLISIKQFGTMTKILLNMSAESITPDMDSMLPDRKYLLPYEAVLFRP